MATPAIRNLIREGKTHQIYSAMQAGAKHGMHTMDQHLADLVKKGRITYETGLEKCHHVEDFNRLAAEAERHSDGSRTLTFQYSVRDKTGKVVSGTLEADSQAAVATKLKQMGYAPVSISQDKRRHEDRDQDPGLRRQGQAQGPGGHVAAVRDDDQLRAVAAARADDPRPSRPRTRSWPGSSARSATTSRPAVSLSAAMAKHPKVFPPLMVNMTPGRRGRRLPRRGAAADRRELRGRGQAARQDQVGDDLPGRRLRAWPSSPSIGMLLFIVPVFAELFDDLGGELPAPTRVLVFMSNVLKLVLPGLRRRLHRASRSCGRKVKHQPTGPQRRRPAEAQDPGLRHPVPEDRARAGSPATSAR